MSKTAMKSLCLVALLSSSGCRESRSQEEQAAQVVRGFFELLPNGDCQQIEGLISAARDCEAVVQEFRSHGVKLLEVLSVEPDGRQETAMLVRVRLEQNGMPQKQSALLRVERDRGVWRYKP